jgi:hypothetical protein
MSTASPVRHPKRVTIVAALSGLVLVAASFLVGGGIDNAAAGVSESPAPASAARAVTSTRITLLIDRCRHCPVALFQARTDPIRVWHTGWKNVHHGRVTFRVPTHRTHSMSIDLNPTWSDANAVTNVVIRYADEQAGDRVTAAVARNKRRAAGCWAGTSDTSVQLKVHVRRYRIKDLEGNPGRAPRAWLATTQAWVPPMVRAKRGAIGNQDAFFCSR